MMTSTLDITDWVYSKKATVEMSGSLRDFAEDYAQLVIREGGGTGVRDAVVINMDKCIMQETPRPYSMDFAIAVETRDTATGQKQFILVDCKFNITKPNNVCTNVPDDEIKGKFSSSRAHIKRDCSLPCCDTALFLFKNKNFEQVRRAWGRIRTQNDPKNKAIKISEFETIFTRNAK